MTAIVAVTKGGKTIFGADSLSTIGEGDVRVMSEWKIWKNGPYLFGYSGSGRGGQLARYAFDPPKPRGDLDKFFATTFVNALREVMVQGGHTAKKEGVEKIGSDLLVGVKGRLYIVYDEFDWDRLEDDYAAIGSGALPALGALYATKKMGATRQRLTIALTAAEHYDNTVRHPFRFLDSKDLTTK